MIDFRSEGGVESTGWVMVLGLFLVWGGGTGSAQSDGAGPPSPQRGRFCEEGAASRTLDRRGLAVLYCTTTPSVSVSLRGVHATARPVFYGAAPAAWIGAGLVQNRTAAAAAYRLTLTQGAAYGLVLGIKHAVGRPRPYVPLSLMPRTERHRGPRTDDAFLSFPSGHASLSAALVTSWSLSYPRWYVVTPGALWASAVALSRVYLGVHYPSDILTGSLLGVGMALLVHQLRDAVTPSGLRKCSRAQSSPAVPPLVLRVQF